MYLKSLELHGFKSFPDKIQLSFDEGFTAVVGPNGSGKSNIGDAVRWVLGEQSTKELRGKSMEDVIFSGTKTRRQMGFASVTLTIDNSDHLLSDPEPEVAVTRRLFRNGDSEYLINGRNVRLKDVNELFMDTGLGRDGYAIIGQGRIAEIVGAKSNERRDIFEEAAGVSKFRYKKQEAERKLQQAQDNLVRLTDIVAELESRIGPLKTQAAKAEKYLVLAAEQKTLAVSVWVQKLSQLEEQLRQLSDEYLQASAEYEHLQADLQREDEKLDLAHQDMQDATAEISRLQTAIVAAEQASGGVQSAIAVCGNEISHSEEKIAELKAQQEELKTSGSEREQVLAEQDEYIASLAKRLEELEQQIAAHSDELEALVQKVTESSGRCSDQDAALRELYLQQNEEAVKLSGIAADIAETEDMLHRAESDGASVAERMKSYEAQEKSLQGKLAGIEKKQKEQQNRLEGFAELITLREQKYRQSAEKLTGLEDAIKQTRQKQQLLRDLEQSMEGYAGSVRQVLRVAGSGRLGGVHGTVAQRITVEPQYGTAIETALGGALQNIIVENEDAAKRCIRYLKENNGGRATFLPLTTIRGNRLKENLDGVDGFVALACDLIGYDEQYSSIMYYLLGRIVIAEDIDTATRIAKQYRYSFRIVTLDGQVVHSGGSFTGGSTVKSAGVITRTHEIEAAAEKLRSLESERDSVKTEADRRKAEWAKLITDREGAQALIAELQEQRRDVQQELAALEARAESDAAWQRNEAEQRKRLTDKIAALRKTESEAKSQLDALAETVRSAEAALRQESEAQTMLHSEQEMLNQQISEEKIRQAAQVKELENERRHRISMAQSMEQAESQLEALAESIRTQQSNIAAKKREIEALRSGETERRAEIEVMQKKQQTLRGEYEQKEQYITVLRRGISELQGVSEKQGQECIRLKERQDRVQQESDALISRLQEDFELTRTEAEAAAEPVADMKAAEQQLTTLRNRIRALGNVNVAAVEEYREVSERYADMTAQIKDIEDAKKKLEELIAQLTSDMCEIFSAAFTKINKYFGEIFIDLFGGGSASLELTDPEHILESGIEIKVAPPGKVIKNLISLSGGEQSFVAICIYFAILKLRPAPFCILDEIDAALDEVNVRKYAQYLKRFLGSSQFVVVTHRRSAMDEANVLYGVTMQEDGVSRLLRLDQNGVAVNM